MSTSEEQVANALANGQFLPDPVDFVTEVKALIYGDGFKDGMEHAVARLKVLRDAFTMVANMTYGVDQAATAMIMSATMDHAISMLEGKTPLHPRHRTSSTV